MKYNHGVVDYLGYASRKKFTVQGTAQTSVLYPSCDPDSLELIFTFMQPKTA
jgi:hypothetical protein